MKVSMVNYTNFYGTEAKPKSKNPGTSAQEDLTNNCIENAYREGQKIGLIKGAMLSMLLTSGACQLYQNYTNDKILNDMNKTIKIGNIDKIKIDDYNNTPCIFLVDKNGNADIYDTKNGDIYVKIGDDVVEKD